MQGVAKDVSAIDERLGALEFQRMFSDPNPAFLNVQAGAGGTEALRPIKRSTS